jgi:hypothetical protein
LNARRLAILVLAGAAALLLVRLAGHPAPAPDAALEVQFSGCAQVRRGPVCVPGPDRRLRLWVEAPPGATLEALADDAPLPADATPLPGGTRLAVRLPAETGRLAVRATFGPWRARWTLPLAPADDPDPLAEARAARDQGASDEAAILLDALLDRPLPPDLEARAVGMRARVALHSGAVDDAVTLLLQAVALDHDAGLVSAAADDAMVIAFTLVKDEGRDLDTARRFLAAAAPLIEAYPESRARLPYFRGVIEEQALDGRQALRDYREAALWARRLGMDGVERMVDRRRAALLLIVGRTDEAIALLEAQRADPAARTSDCEYENLSMNLGDSEVQRFSADGAPRPTEADRRRIEARLEDARALAVGTCPQPLDVAMIWTSEAWLALAAGDLDEADRRVAAAMAAVEAAPDAATRRRWALWFFDWEDLRGRIALARGDAATAAEGFARLERLAVALSAPQARGWAAIGRARAAELLGDDAATEAAWRDAEAWLDRASLAIPVGDGRADYVGYHDIGSLRYVAWLLRRGRAPEALAVARHARTRLLTGLEWADRVAALAPDARQRWESVIERYRRGRLQLEGQAVAEWGLAADEVDRVRDEERRVRADLDRTFDEALATLAAAAAPPAPTAARPPDELSLHYFPLPDGAWAGFAQRGAALRAQVLGPIDPAAPPDALATALLAPFAPEIDAARAIRVVPYGALQAVDFHALPWRGDVLLASHPVVYGVDVSPVEPALPEERRALVVADPRGDLPGARAEGAAVAGALATAGWRAEVLQGPQAGAAATRTPADAARVLAALGGASVFVYAGHGTRADADLGGGALPAADGGAVTASDVLALAAAPALVLLSGCETARPPADAAPESPGVAQAFVMRGSAVVVATTRDVADDVRFGEALGDSAFASPDALVEATRAAQLRLRARRPRGDWAAWRTLVP